MIQKTFPVGNIELPSKFRPLVEMARTDILEIGISNFTIENLAVKLHISKKTIYKYFPSKNDLIKAVLNLYYNQICAKVQAVEINLNDPLATISIILKTVYQQTSKMSSKTFYEVKLYYPDYWQKIEQFRENVIQQLSELFNIAQKQGLIRKDVNLYFIIQLIMKIVQDIFQPEFLVNSPYTFTNIIPSFIDLIMNGLLEKSHAIDFQQLLNPPINQNGLL